MSARRVPLALQHGVKQELDEMVSRGTLEPVRSSPWASPMVTVAKAGSSSLRLCADYTATLSPAIDMEAYPIPHPEDIFAQLSGKKWFSKLDVRCCYEQFPLDPASKELLTVNIIKGLFRYTSLPYGISSAPAIVQRAMEEILAGIDDVFIYYDDLLLGHADLDSHLATLRKVLKRLQDFKVRLNKEECIFASQSVEYFGFILSAEGRKPDPEKIHAMLKAPPLLRLLFNLSRAF